MLIAEPAGSLLDKFCTTLYQEADLTKPGLFEVWKLGAHDLS